jgi:hypothetical protein
VDDRLAHLLELRPQFPPVNEPTLVLVINQAWNDGESPQVGKATRNDTQLILGVANGIVRGAYLPDTWTESTLPGQSGRWRFDGHPATEFERFIGTSLDRLVVPRGASNPVRVYGEGIPAHDGLSPDEPWEIALGEFLGREERAAIYGGGTQSGIEPSSTSSYLFLYSDPLKGLAFGYNFDGWSEDSSVFYYTGEGRTGDHVLTGKNGSLLNHVSTEQRLKLFVADGFEKVGRAVRQRYVGEFRVDSDDPYHFTEGYDINGDERRAVVFRLRPVGLVDRREREKSTHPLAEGGQVEQLGLGGVELEDLVNEIEIEFMHSPSSMHVNLERVQKVVRREAALVVDFRNYLEAQTRSLVRHKIRPLGLPVTLFTDAYEPEEDILYEAKANSSRESIRMAIGQLADYSRFLPTARLVVLLPSRPIDNLVDLLSHAKVGLCYRNKDSSFTWVWPKDIPTAE